MTTTTETARTVLLRLDGPLQSYGTHSRFERRDTAEHPTASAVTGLIACALGYTRTQPLGPLAHLEIAIRVDQPGQVARDYQTVGIDGWLSASGKITAGEPKLSQRYYLHDAVFTAAVGHPDPDTVTTIATALARPHRPLYLGRKSCPPAAPILIGVSEQQPAHALSTLPYQGHRHAPPATLPVITTDPTGRGDTVQDVPIDFGQRSYGLRTVTRHAVPTPPRPTAPADPEPDNPYGI